MQRLIEHAKKQVASFIEQRDDLILLTPCSDDDSAILLKLYRDAEQSNSTDVFLLFSDSFVMPGPFVSVIAERLREQRRIACEALREKDEPLLPPIPEIVFDDTQHPSYRLYNAIEYARSLVPAGGGNRLVWLMCPQAIADRQAYLQLVAPFVPANVVQPWMRGLRLVIRDLPWTGVLAPDWAQARRVRVVPFDASPGAVQKSLEEEAHDERAPMDQRMQSLLQLALLDGAHNRNAAAIERYQTLVGHDQTAKNPAMQALVLNGLGDIFHKAGDLDQAQHWYECGVPLAGEAKDGVILSTLIRNLANLTWAKGEFQIADQYFGHLDQLAAHLLSPEAKIEALVWRGLCQERLGALPKAVESWEGAATLARSVGLPPFETMALTHLERSYRVLGMSDHLAVVRQQLQVVHAGGNG